MKITRFRFLVLLTALISVIVVIVIQLHNTNAEINFLNDVLSGDDDAAFTNLSSDFQKLVRSHCPNSEVTGCIRRLISPDWGELKEIRFAIGSDRSSTQLFHTFWSCSSEPISIVLITTEENGKRVINGWRGFIVSESEDADSQLLHGERHDNEFSAG